jgi:hypothetical protein
MVLNKNKIISCAKLEQVQMIEYGNIKDQSNWADYNGYVGNHPYSDMRGINSISNKYVIICSSNRDILFLLFTEVTLPRGLLGVELVLTPFKPAPWALPGNSSLLTLS